MSEINATPTIVEETDSTHTDTPETAARPKHHGKVTSSVISAYRQSKVQARDIFNHIAGRKQLPAVDIDDHHDQSLLEEQAAAVAEAEQIVHENQEPAVTVEEQTFLDELEQPHQESELQEGDEKRRFVSLALEHLKHTVDPKKNPAFYVMLATAIISTVAHDMDKMLVSQLAERGTLAAVGWSLGGEAAKALHKNELKGKFIGAVAGGLAGSQAIDFAGKMAHHVPTPHVPVPESIGHAAESMKHAVGHATEPAQTMADKLPQPVKHVSERVGRTAANTVVNSIDDVVLPPAAAGLKKVFRRS